MRIVRGGAQDVEATVRSLVAAFAEDPLTGYLMQPGEGYEDRLAQFFSLLMRARLALDAPVLVAKPVNMVNVVNMVCRAIPAAHTCAGAAVVHAGDAPTAAVSV